MIWGRRDTNWEAPTLLVFVSISCSVSFLWTRGILYGGDSTRYLDAARRLLAGEPLVGKQGSFLGYSAFLALCEVVTGGLWLAIAAQMIFAALAALILLRMGETLSGNRTVGIVSGLIFAANPDIARFHSALLTDSFYISIVPFVMWAFYRAAQRPSAWRCIVALGLAGISTLVRPNGWLLLVGGAGILLWRLSVSWVARGLLVLSAVVGLVLIASTLNVGRSIKGGEPDQMLRAGVIIWNDPHVKVMPSSSLGPGLHSGLEYALQHPLASGGLALRRVTAELWHSRRFYSRAHNLVASGYVVTLYVFALMAGKASRDRLLAATLLVTISLQILLVAVTFADWDGRFLLHVLPLIGVFSAAGFWRSRAWFGTLRHFEQDSSGD